MRTDENNSGSERIALLGLSEEGLRQALMGVVGARWRGRDYRYAQLYRGLHVRGVSDPMALTELPLEERKLLGERCTLERPRIDRRQRSVDGTTKFLFGVAGGAAIEAVDIPDGGRRTLCISSQAGCALACRFCVTGFWGAGRDLAPHELVGQVYAIRETQDIAWEHINLVLMGMGEPLLNLPAVHAALEALAHHIAWRRMTVSTAGVVPGIEEMARWEARPNLAVSLHSARDEERSSLMPINRKYPLAELMTALRQYPATRHRPITFEYTLIQNRNDDNANARDVARLIRGLEAKVNLIPINPDPVLGEEMVPPSWERIREFQNVLLAQGLRCSVRRPRGDDVSAACGQLRAADRVARGLRKPDQREVAPRFGAVAAVTPPVR